MIEDLKVKTILVSQPEPKSGTSPYHELGKNQKVNVDFRSFIHLEPVLASDVRQQKVSFTDHTAVILTSRHAADHYFRICQEMRFEVPASMKYFCMSEAIAFICRNTLPIVKEKYTMVNSDLLILLGQLKSINQKSFYYLLLTC